METTTKEPTTRTSASTQHEVLAALWSLCHRAGAAHSTVPASQVIDLFLDAYNVTGEPAVRDELCRQLARFNCRSLLTPEELQFSLHEVGAAVATEAAFDHLLIT